MYITLLQFYAFFDSMASFDDHLETLEEDDCCGNGCNPCILDVRKKLLDEWKHKKVPPDKNALSPTKYRKFIVELITKASEDCLYLQLKYYSENNDYSVSLSPSQHVILKLTSTSKPYTPISWSEKHLKLLIKLYSNGKASASINQLKVGDELFIRGPYGEFKYQPNSYKYIVMLSIGSGIAAMYPLAVSIVKNEIEDTKINFICGFRTSLHVPLKNELRLLSDYWNFECTLCLSQENNVNISGIKIINNRLNEQIIDETLSSFSPETSLILICGTPEFNDSMQNIVTKKEFLHYHIFR